MIKFFNNFLVLFCILLLIFVSGCSHSPNHSFPTNTQANNYSSSNDAIVETKWFTLNFPDNWANMYVLEEEYKESCDELNFIVSMKSNNDYGKAFLFQIVMHPLLDLDYVNGSLESDRVHPIGILTTDNGVSYYVSYFGASEAACTTEELEQFINFANEIPNCLSTFEVKNDVQFQEWNDTILDELKATIDNSTPYAPCYFNAIGYKFEIYKNQSGKVFYDISDRDLSNYGFNKIDGVSYYLASGEVIAVDDGYIVAVSIGHDSAISVRELIKKQNITGLYELFNVTPEISFVKQNSIMLYTWKTDNGYIGITSVGSSDPQWLYDNTVISFMAFTNKKFISYYN